MYSYVSTHGLETLALLISAEFSLTSLCDMFIWRFPQWELRVPSLSIGLNTFTQFFQHVYSITQCPVWPQCCTHHKILASYVLPKVRSRSQFTHGPSSSNRSSSFPLSLHCLFSFSHFSLYHPLLWSDTHFRQNSIYFAIALLSGLVSPSPHSLFLLIYFIVEYEIYHHAFRNQNITGGLLRKRFSSFLISSLGRGFSIIVSWCFSFSPILCWLVVVVLVKIIHLDVSSPLPFLPQEREQTLVCLCPTPHSCSCLSDDISPH